MFHFSSTEITVRFHSTQKNFESIKNIFFSSPLDENYWPLLIQTKSDSSFAWKFFFSLSLLEWLSNTNANRIKFSFEENLIRSEIKNSFRLSLLSKVLHDHNSKWIRSELWRKFLSFVLDRFRYSISIRTGQTSNQRQILLFSLLIEINIHSRVKMNRIRIRSTNSSLFFCSNPNWFELWFERNIPFSCRLRWTSPFDQNSNRIRFTRRENSCFPFLRDRSYCLISVRTDATFESMKKLLFLLFPRSK